MDFVSEYNITKTPSGFYIQKNGASAPETFVLAGNKVEQFAKVREFKHLFVCSAGGRDYIVPKGSIFSKSIKVYGDNIEHFSSIKLAKDENGCRGSLKNTNVFIASVELVRGGRGYSKECVLDLKGDVLDFPLPQEDIHYWLRTAHAYEKRALAQCGKNNPEIDLVLAQDRSDMMLGYLVARNTKHPSVLEQLAQDERLVVRMGVAQNKNTPKDILNFLYDDRRSYSKEEALLQMPSASFAVWGQDTFFKTLHTVFAQELSDPGNQHWAMKKSLLNNPNISHEIVTAILDEIFNHPLVQNISKVDNKYLESLLSHLAEVCILHPQLDFNALELIKNKKIPNNPLFENIKQYLNIRIDYVRLCRNGASPQNIVDFMKTHKLEVLYPDVRKFLYKGNDKLFKARTLSDVLFLSKETPKEVHQLLCFDAGKLIIDATGEHYDPYTVTPSFLLDSREISEGSIMGLFENACKYLADLNKISWTDISRLDQSGKYMEVQESVLKQCVMHPNTTFGMLKKMLALLPPNRLPNVSSLLYLRIEYIQKCANTKQSDPNPGMPCFSFLGNMAKDKNLMKQFILLPETPQPTLELLLSSGILSILNMTPSSYPHEGTPIEFDLAWLEY